MYILESRKPKTAERGSSLLHYTKTMEMKFHRPNPATSPPQHASLYCILIQPSSCSFQMDVDSDNG
jgi:hypothetical protein